MTEDNFEKFLKKTAQTYNVPPVRVPREEMWTAIQAKRAAGPRVVYGGGAARAASERRFGTRVWLGAAAAAMLLVATGVGIGRWTASTPSVAGNQPIPTQPVTVTGPDERNSVEPPANPQVATTTSPSGTQPTAAANTSVRERRPSDAGARTTTTRVATGGTNHSGSPSTSAYQITAVQNLSEAEALLTSFRSRSGADQQMDAQLGTWARQLLTNTRLLLDSPVGDDPQRRPLLQDLELVLVQIVQQLSPGSTPQDRDLIEKTMRDNHVMTRLRTAIPAGAQRGS
jgi:hypothetical protein